MSKQRWAAIVCFAAALACYWLAGSQAAGGGFAFLGFIFEVMAWRKALGARGDQ
jgi:hypothetical protein